LIETEVKDLNRIIQEIDSSRRRLELEINSQQENELWKFKMEKIARLQLSMEKLQRQFQLESNQINRKLENESISRKLLKSKLKQIQNQLPSRKSYDDNQTSEIEVLKRTIEADVKTRLILESSKKDVEAELQLISSKLALEKESNSNGSNSDRKWNVNLRENVNPSKFSFREKLTFWNALKLEFPL